MARYLIALACGLIFGIGLTISQMIDPAKVLGFLDVGAIPAGGWDPSLLFVMIGAIGVAAPAYYLTGQRARPVIGHLFLVPKRNDINLSLVSGSLIFGAGWGLAGICPGPAISALGLGNTSIYWFFGAMLIGMAISIFQNSGRLPQQPKRVKEPESGLG